ncbi:unnamed protein product [Ixodes hexagonus]
MAASLPDPEAPREAEPPLKSQSTRPLPPSSPPRPSSASSPSSVLVVFLDALLPVSTLGDLAVEVLLAALTVYMVLSLAGAFQVTGGRGPGRRPPPFRCDDPKLRSPFLVESIRTRDLLTVVGLGPPVILLALDLRRGAGSALRDRAFWAGRLLRRYFVGLILVGAATQLLKDVVSEKRPYFLDSCRPVVVDVFSGNVTPACETPSMAFVTDYVCLGPPRGVSRSFDSFPSGHASGSCYGGFFLIGYVVWRGDAVAPASVRVLVVALLSAASAAVSVSRIVDMMHFWWDVAVGAALGLGLAVALVVWPFS